jgi:hypothetical protein
MKAKNVQRKFKQKYFLSRKASNLDPLTDPIIHNKSLISHSVVNIYSKSRTFSNSIFSCLLSTKNIQSEKKLVIEVTKILEKIKGGKLLMHLRILFHIVWR